LIATYREHRVLAALAEGTHVIFDRGIDVFIMSIDGTWRRACSMHEVSDVSVKLKIPNSIQGLNLKEFFLVLSSTGLAFRRCEIEWVNGDQIGAKFVKQCSDKKMLRPQAPADR
jgi:hypothetical protein